MFFDRAKKFIENLFETTPPPAPAVPQAPTATATTTPVPATGAGTTPEAAGVYAGQFDVTGDASLTRTAAALKGTATEHDGDTTSTATGDLALSSALDLVGGGTLSRKQDSKAESGDEHHALAAKLGKDAKGHYVAGLSSEDSTKSKSAEAKTASSIGLEGGILSLSKADSSSSGEGKGAASESSNRKLSVGKGEKGFLASYADDTAVKTEHGEAKAAESIGYSQGVLSGAMSSSSSSADTGAGSSHALAAKLGKDAKGHYVAGLSSENSTKSKSAEAKTASSIGLEGGIFSLAKSDSSSSGKGKDLASESSSRKLRLGKGEKGLVATFADDLSVKTDKGEAKAAESIGYENGVFSAAQSSSSSSTETGAGSGHGQSLRLGKTDKGYVLGGSIENSIKSKNAEAGSKLSAGYDEGIFSLGRADTVTSGAKEDLVTEGMSRTAKLGKGEHGWVAGYTQDESVKTAKGEATVGYSAGYDNGMVSLGTSQMSGTAGDDKVSSGGKTSVRFGKGEKGWGGGFTTESDVKTAKGEGKASTSLGYDAGTVSLVRKGGSSSALAETGKASSETTNTYSYNKETGLTLGRDWSSSKLNADESKSTWKGGVSTNVQQGQFGGNLSHSLAGKDGKPLGSIGGAGAIDLDKHGNLQGLSGSLSYSKGPASVSVSKSYSVTAKAVEVNGKWAVSWQATDSSGGSLGLSSTNEETSSGAGVKASASRSSVKTGMHPCASKAEAEAFAKDAAQHLEKDLQKPLRTAEDVLAMPVGETRSFDESKQKGLGVTGSAGGLDAGLGVDRAQGDHIDMKKLGPTVVELTLTHGEQLGGKGSFGTMAAGMGVNASKASADSQTVKIDLSTDEGKAAYKAFTEEKKLTAGAHLVADSHEESRSKGTTVSMLGSELAVTGTVSHKTIHEKNGRETDIDKGSRATNVSVPLLGEFSRDVGLVSTETDHKERTHTLRESVKSTHGGDIMMELAGFAGVNHEAGLGNEKASGKWTISQAVKDDDMVDFAAKLIEHPGMLVSLRAQRGDGTDLREALLKSKNAGDMVKALDEFMAATGHTGVEFLEQSMGIKIDTDLELSNDKGEHDKNFQGAAWRQGLEGKLDLFSEGLANAAVDKRQLAREMTGEIQELMARRSEIADPEKYTDLPRALRAQEVQRTDAWLAKLQAMQQQAVAGARGTAEPPVATFTPLDPVAAKAQSVGTEVAALEAQVKNARSGFEGAYGASLHSRGVHSGSWSMGGTAREKLGGDGWLFKGKELAAYKDADKRYDDGKSEKTQADAVERELVAARLEYNLAETPEEQIQAATALKAVLTHLSGHYATAGTKMTGAESGYRGIAARNEDQGGAFQGYHKEAKPLL